jgi:pimeloyl-ACP methyl ester carboxylesterase
MPKSLLAAAVLTLTLAFAAHAEEVKIGGPGGLTLNGSLETAAGKNLTDGVMLVVHGSLAHRDMEIVQALQSLLKENGWSSLAVNLSLAIDDRHGMYDCAVPHRHRHEDAVAEIGAWIGWLQGRGAKDIVLVGHSRGGNQVAWYAAEHPDAPVSALALIAPSTWDATSAAQAYRAAYGKELEPLLKQAEDLVASGQGGRLLGPLGFLHCQESQVSARSLVSYYAPNPRFDTPALLPGLKPPVMVFAGTEDTVVAGLIERVRPLADGKRVRLTVIDGADHFFRDLYAEELVERLAEAFESL